MVSLPSRERGLKFICSLSFISCGLYVAPLAGAWIEIMDAIDQIHQLGKSLPSRERGLKLMENVEEIQQWGRSPRGSVD